MDERTARMYLAQLLLLSPYGVGRLVRGIEKDFAKAARVSRNEAATVLAESNPEAVAALTQLIVAAGGLQRLAEAVDKGFDGEPLLAEGFCRVARIVSEGLSRKPPLPGGFYCLARCIEEERGG